MKITNLLNELSKLTRIQFKHNYSQPKPTNFISISSLVNKSCQILSAVFLPLIFTS